MMVLAFQAWQMKILEWIECPEQGHYLVSWPTPGLEGSGNGTFIRSQSETSFLSPWIDATTHGSIFPHLHRNGGWQEGGRSHPLPRWHWLRYCSWEMEEVSASRYSSPLEILWQPRRVQCFHLLGSEAEVKWQGWRERILRNSCSLPRHLEMCVLKSEEDMCMFCLHRDSQWNQSPWFLIISQTGKKIYF